MMCVVMIQAMDCSK